MPVQFSFSVSSVLVHGGGDRERYQVARGHHWRRTSQPAKAGTQCSAQRNERESLSSSSSNSLAVGGWSNAFEVGSRRPDGGILMMSKL